MEMSQSTILRRPASLLVLGGAFLVMASPARAAIPTGERDALIAIYNATGGPGWLANIGWLGPVGTECSWYGVACDATQSTVTRLLLGVNNLIGSIPAEIGDLTSLTVLDLGGNELGGSIPSELGNLASLRYLALAFNDLTGTIPTTLGNLTLLEELQLDTNRLSGSIPAELGDLTALRILYLAHNLLSGTIPPELGNLASLVQLLMLDNSLSGTIPPELGSLPLLEALTLDVNALSGSIPPELGDLASLRYLSLASNQLSGRIPPELGNLTALLSLDLGDNRLSGGLPPELGSLTSLTVLDLGRNRLHGALPAELGNLSSVQRLYLDGNALGGKIPASLGNLATLYDNVGLDLRWNALTSNDPFLKAFLNGKQIGNDWQSTQTIPPANVSASYQAPASVAVTWTPIVYVQDGGGYEVSLGPTPGGPYRRRAMTATKTASSLIVSGVPSGTRYVIVRTVTNSHPSNQNTVTSTPSPEVSVVVPISPPRAADGSGANVAARALGW